MTAEELRNIIRSMSKPTYEVDYSPGAVSLADARKRGFIPLTGVVDLSVNASVEKTDAYVSFRGTSTKAKAASGNSDLGYTITTNNMTPENLGLILSHDPDFDMSSLGGADNARAAIAATAGLAFDFDEGADGLASKPGRWYQIVSAGGVHIRDLSAVTFAGVNAAYGASQDATGLLLDTDYYIDLEAGLVQFVNEINDDVITPTITCAEITSASLNYMKRIAPLKKPLKEVYLTIRAYDEDANSRLVWEHEPFRANLVVDAGPSGTGEFMSGSIMTDVLDGSSALARV